MTLLLEVLFRVVWVYMRRETVERGGPPNRDNAVVRIVIYSSLHVRVLENGL